MARCIIGDWVEYETIISQLNKREDFKAFSKGNDVKGYEIMNFLTDNLGLKISIWEDDDGFFAIGMDIEEADETESIASLKDIVANEVKQIFDMDIDAHITTFEGGLIFSD